MVTVSDRKQADNDFERRARNASIAGFLITIVAASFMVTTTLLQILLGEDYYGWIASISVIGGITAMILVRQNKVVQAAVAVIASLFGVAFLYAFLMEDVATPLAVIMIILSLGITIQTINPEKLGTAIIVVMLTGTSVIMLDRFWPSLRHPSPPYIEQTIVVSGFVTILILAIIVFRQFPSYSLRGKLIGATLAVALLSVGVVAFGVNLFTTDAITSQVGANLNSLAESESLLIGEFLAREVDALKTLSVNQTIIDTVKAGNARYAESANPPSKQIAIASGKWARATADDEIVSSILNSDASTELNKFTQLFPEHIELIVTDKYGAQIGATVRTRDYYKGDDNWWRNTYADGLGEIYINEPTFRSDYDAFVINLGVPIYSISADGSEEIIGVITTVLDLDILGGILKESNFSETGTYEIFLSENRHVYINDEGILAYKDSDLDEKSLQYVQDPQEPFIVTNFENIDRFLSSAYLSTLTDEPAIDRLGWIVLSTQHADEILAPVDQQQRLNTILGIIVVISAGAVAALVGQYISKPISNLTKVAEEVAGGRYDVQAPIETKDEIGVLANSFNNMTAQLRESITTLEERVQNRTQALATTLEVGRQLSTILNEKELLNTVVNQVRDSFDYYQAQIYLLSDDKQSLEMAAGTGEAGKQMISNKHQLPIGTGLVGQAAETNIINLVPDTSQVDDWLANPLLPETKSETAVPISIGDDVLGVLDVQHNVVNGLQQEDADLLQSVANQVAVALRNARLYKETELQAQQEALLRSINQKIASTTDMESAMKIAIREIGQAVGSSETRIRLSTSKSENGHPRDNSENT